MDGWMTCDFSTVFQSYQDDERLIMKACVQWSSIYSWEDFASSEDQTRSARSVGQRLTHWATGAPNPKKNNFLSPWPWHQRLPSKILIVKFGPISNHSASIKRIPSRVKEIWVFKKTLTKTSNLDADADTNADPRVTTIPLPELSFRSAKKGQYKCIYMYWAESFLFCTYNMVHFPAMPIKHIQENLKGYWHYFSKGLGKKNKINKICMSEKSSAYQDQCDHALQLYTVCHSISICWM